jgi:urease gamma subunit
MNSTLINEQHKQKILKLNKSKIQTYMTFMLLTNAADGHQGNKVAIRKDLVVSVHQKFDKNEDNIIAIKTFIFCPPHGTWEVSESMEDVIQQLNEK